MRNRQIQKQINIMVFNIYLVCSISQSHNFHYLFVVFPFYCTTLVSKEKNFGLQYKANIMNSLSCTCNMHMPVSACPCTSLSLRLSFANGWRIYEAHTKCATIRIKVHQIHVRVPVRVLTKNQQQQQKSSRIMHVKSNKRDAKSVRSAYANWMQKSLGKCN